MNDAQFGGANHIVGRNLSAESGKRTVDLSPHTIHNGGFKLDGFKSVGPVYGFAIHGGFLPLKQTNKTLTPGTFAKGFSFRNVDPTFGRTAQLKD